MNPDPRAVPPSDPRRRALKTNQPRLSDDTWRAIAQRKQLRPREVSIGQLAQRQVERIVGVAGPELQEIKDSLQGVVGPDFEAHCRLVSCKGGRLTVAVDDPARVDMLRRAYLFVLMERLAGLAPRIKVTDVHWTVYRER